MRTIISTVGKSLLGNAAHKLNKDNLGDQALNNYLRHTEEVAAAAETNALKRLIEEDDNLIFLHSATEEGRQCGKALASYYANQGFRAETQEVTDLNYQESRFKMQGLRFLVENLIELIERERNKKREVLINATGGFKAEIAYATMLGLLMKVPVYYIHELFDDIIEMPPSPIDWDYSFVAEFDEFFNWITADLRTIEAVNNKLAEIENKIKARAHRLGKGIADIRMLLTEEEGHVLLSPTGETYYKSYQSFLQTADKYDLFISRQAKNTFEKLKPDLKEKFKNVFQKLTVKELWLKSVAQKKGDCLVYPQGHINERVFFSEEEIEGQIYILELTRHSDESYDKKLEEGVWTDNYNFSDFSKLTPQQIWG